MPMMIKNGISNQFHERSYVTWNKTSLPVRYGFMACRSVSTAHTQFQNFLLTDKVIVATKAQTKLRHIVLMLKLLVISCIELRMKV